MQPVAATEKLKKQLMFAIEELFLLDYTMITLRLVYADYECEVSFSHNFRMFLICNLNFVSMRVATTSLLFS